MEIRRTSVSFLLSLIAVGSAYAAPDETLFGRELDRFGVKPPAVTFTMFGGSYLNGLDQQLYNTRDYVQKAWNMGIRAGYAFTPHLEAEAAFAFTPTQTKTAEENVFMYAVNALGQYPLSDVWVPYVTLGIGAVTFAPDDRVQATKFAVNYGAGLKWFFYKNLALRPDIRALSSFDPGHTAVLLTLNLTYYLALGKRVESKPVDTAAPAPVPTPTPQPAPEASPKAEPTPAPVPVPAGPSATDRSELEQFSGVIEGIRFDTNSAKIRPESHETLDHASAFFAKHPVLNVRIEGHTDDTGGSNLNNRLARDRAEAVMRYMKVHGADKNAFEAVGYGSTRPLASNATKAGRAKNRRIEFKVLNPEAL